MKVAAYLKALRSIRAPRGTVEGPLLANGPHGPCGLRVRRDSSMEEGPIVELVAVEEADYPKTAVEIISRFPGNSEIQFFDPVYGEYLEPDSFDAVIGSDKAARRMRKAVKNSAHRRTPSKLLAETQLNFTEDELRTLMGNEEFNRVLQAASGPQGQAAQGVALSPELFGDSLSEEDLEEFVNFVTPLSWEFSDVENWLRFLPDSPRTCLYPLTDGRIGVLYPVRASEVPMLVASPYVEEGWTYIEVRSYLDSFHNESRVAVVHLAPPCLASGEEYLDLEEFAGLSWQELGQKLTQQGHRID